MNEPTPMMVGLQALGWDARRIAAALAVAAPNDLRIAQAALEKLTLHDHAGTFAAWCDAQAGRRDE